MNGKNILAGVSKHEAELIQDLRYMLKNWAYTYDIRCRIGDNLQHIDDDTIDILSYRVLDIVRAKLLQNALFYDA